MITKTPQAPMTVAANARGDQGHAGLIWGIVLLAWLVALCVVPDPRPLGAPEWVVDGLRSFANVSEPTARALATGVLRAAGLAIIGVLLSLALGQVRLRYAAPIVLFSAPLLAIIVKWINFGYFPIALQIGFILLFAVLGGLIGLALRRSRIALTVLGLVVGGLFLSGASTGITGDLYEATKLTGLHVLRHADEVPTGDQGFAKLLEIAFLYAEDNSHGVDPVLPNQAAILALGVILGDERVASVARRELDPGTRDARRALRRRIRLRGRGDLAQHFWVSGALAVISGASRSLSVGLTKRISCRKSTACPRAFRATTFSLSTAVSAEPKPDGSSRRSTNGSRLRPACSRPPPMVSGRSAAFPRRSRTAVRTTTAPGETDGPTATAGSSASYCSNTSSTRSQANGSTCWSASI